MSNEQMTASKARLRAEDAEDLAVIAAFLQDAATNLKEMVYTPDEQRFIGVFKRFRREHQADWNSCDGLTLCTAALTFEQVASAKYRGLDARDLDRPLSLLTIATEPGQQQLIHIDLVFEGGAEIQLRTDQIMAKLEDLDEPVLAKTTPCDHFKEILDSAG